MGNYKSRPQTSCSDELKKKISECYAVVRSRLGDDSRPRCAIWNQIQNAAYERSPEEFSSLLTAEVLDCQTPQRLSLLHLICAGHSENQHQKVTELLEKCDESQRATLLSQLTNNGFCALHLAVHKGDVLIVKVLLKEGADPSQAGRHLLPPLHLAAMMGNDTAVQALLDAGAPLYSPDFVKFTPLHCATYSAHENVVKLLLDRAADANSAGGVRDRPLHLSAARGLVNIANMLLDAGADPLLADDEGTLALHFAARSGHIAILQLLLKRTKQVAEAVSTRNVYGDTPLHVACYGGRLDVVRALLPLAPTAILTMENVFSETPLHAACTGGRSVELVALLLRQAGIHANAQGMDGHTPLHSACYHGHVRIVQYLLENGADQSLTAKACDTPLSAAAQTTAGWKPSPVAQAMIRLNRPEPPSPNMSSHDSTLSFEDQQTPIIWAYERGHDHIVALLKHYANQTAEGDVASEYSSGESSYTPLPSPMGRLHSITREKAEILQLRGALRPSAHLSLGEVDFQEAIGSGSFGKVYRGTYRGKVVAIKRYRAMAYGCKSEVDMLCREVSILSRLSHPNVICFIGAALDDKSQFAIVTEFAENGSLFAILHEQKRVLESSFRLRISLDVARGMRYLHELSSAVIHRDLNSHNILIHADGRAVVADFGESRFASQAEEENMTKQPGNLRWMAPEVFSQSGRYDKAVDVFSFALVVWETHAAELPFSHLKPAAAAAEMAYKKGRPTLPKQATVQFPSHVLTLLPNAWNPDPNERPSFTEIVPLLEPHVDSQANMETQSSVSQLKTQWEQLCVSPVKTGSSSSQLPPPFHRLSASGTVEELRQRLDRNGYITQPASFSK